MNHGTTIFWTLLVAIGCAGAPAVDHAANGTGKDRSGAEVYEIHCTLCHGSDGKLGLSGAKDLTVSSLSEEEMRKIVLDGKGGMVPYKSVLSPREVDAVVEHVRSLRQAE